MLVGEKWGKGVVIECRSCIIEWLFNEIKVYKIYGQPSFKNIAAVFNYQKKQVCLRSNLKIIKYQNK